MKNSIFNKKEVPAVHPGCSLAETGRGEYDDFDNPLKPLDIIPESKKESVLKKDLKPYVCDGENYEEVKYVLSHEIVNPAQVREEALVTVVIPSGVHPVTFLKEHLDIEKAWVFMHNDVVQILRDMPRRFYHDTVAYGEFFRFENFDTISLQKVEHFDKWKVLVEWDFGEGVCVREDIPEFIIELVIEK